MRIVAGKYRSRILQAPKGESTRPTLDKVREAVFSSRGGFFDGGRMLDLYAGSGAVALEALSRGMEEAVLCDSSREAVAVIKKNVEALKEDHARILPVKARQAVRILSKEGIPFDLVYLDPPYRFQENEAMIELLASASLLSDQAVAVIESLKEDMFPERIGPMEQVRTAVYGITRISYYRMRKE